MESFLTKSFIGDLSYHPPPASQVGGLAHTFVTGRKTWKTLKSTKNEAVWPVHIEAALFDALEKYRPTSSGDPRLLRRFPKRNRFISDHIYKLTGKLRTPKQVGSRLQQLRDTCQEERVLHLLSRREFPPSLLEDHALSSPSSTSSPSDIYPSPSDIYLPQVYPSDIYLPQVYPSDIYLPPKSPSPLSDSSANTQWSSSFHDHHLHDHHHHHHHHQDDYYDDDQYPHHHLQYPHPHQHQHHHTLHSHQSSYDQHFGIAMPQPVPVGVSVPSQVDLMQLGNGNGNSNSGSSSNSASGMNGCYHNHQYEQVPWISVAPEVAGHNMHSYSQNIHIPFISTSSLLSTASSGHSTY